MIVHPITIDDNVVTILICVLVFVPIVWGPLDARQKMVEEARSKILFKSKYQYLVTAKIPKSHLESVIALIFNEPLCEICGTRTLLGHPVPFVAPVLLVICVLRVWLRMRYFGGGRDLRLRQVLEHSGIEPRVTLFVCNLADKAIIPVCHPIPHPR